MKPFTHEPIQLVRLGKDPGLADIRLLLIDVEKLKDDLVFNLGRLLSPQELHKAARFRSVKDRRTYLCGRGMLRKMASELLNVPATDLVIEEGRYGKPYFDDFRKTLPFNLSNSGSKVALAFDIAGKEVGVDLEKIDRNFEYWEIAGHYFSPKECTRVFNHKDFYRIWTTKEALLKVTGAGLVDDLPSIDLSGKMNRIEACDERLLPFKNKAFTLYTFDNEEIVCTLAVAGAHHYENMALSEDAFALAVRHVYFY